MGKITGFLEYPREDRAYAPVKERVKHWNEFVVPLAEKAVQHASRALHGLRHSLLPLRHVGHDARLPGQQPDPRLERPRLSRQLAAGAGQPALDQQLPRSDRPHLPGAVRRLVHAQPRRQSRRHQDHRMRHRRQGLGGRLDRAATGRNRRPAKQSPSSARARPAWRRRSSSRAPATPSTSTRRTRGRAA